MAPGTQEALHTKRDSVRPLERKLSEGVNASLSFGAAPGTPGAEPDTEQVLGDACHVSVIVPVVNNVQGALSKASPTNEWIHAGLSKASRDTQAH